MSCGEAHAVDCNEVLEEVFLYLDGELEVSRKVEIRQHLGECGPCLRKFGIEEEIKVLVARRCGGERAPESLRISVLRTLRDAGFTGGSADAAASSQPTA